MQLRKLGDGLAVERIEAREPPSLLGRRRRRGCAVAALATGGLAAGVVVGGAGATKPREGGSGAGRMRILGRSVISTKV